MTLVACAMLPSQTREARLPVIEEFTSAPPSVLLSEPSVLKWNVVGATDISIDKGIGKVYPYATRVVFPTENITYTLTATNAAGTVTISTHIAACYTCGCRPWRLAKRQGYEVYLDTVNCFTIRYPSSWTIDMDRFASLNSRAGGVLGGVSFSNHRIGSEYAFFDILIENKAWDFKLLDYASQYKSVQWGRGFNIVSERGPDNSGPSPYSVHQTYNRAGDDREFVHRVRLRTTSPFTRFPYQLWIIRYEGRHDVEMEKMITDIYFLR